MKGNAGPTGGRSRQILKEKWFSHKAFACQRYQVEIFPGAINARSPNLWTATGFCPSSTRNSWVRGSFLLNPFFRIMTWLFSIGGACARVESTNSKSYQRESDKKPKNSLPMARPEKLLCLSGAAGPHPPLKEE